MRATQRLAGSLAGSAGVNKLAAVHELDREIAGLQGQDAERRVAAARPRKAAGDAFAEAVRRGWIAGFEVTGAGLVMGQ